MSSEKSIVSLLGEGSDAEKYYVYALCAPDTHIPFYIGKGEGERIWAHEEGQEKEEAAIRAEKELSEQEKQSRIENLSKKYTAIRDIRQKTGLQPEKVIIKWGLTSHEAFMAESALINLYSFLEKNGDIQIDELTNKANGHASTREKACLTFDRVEARTVQDFERMLLKKDIAKVKDRCVVFIRINKEYEKEYKDGITPSEECLKLVVNGFWRMGERVAAALAHGERVIVVGLYHRVVKCVFSVEGIISTEDFAKEGADRYKEAEATKAYWSMFCSPSRAVHDVECLNCILNNSLSSKWFKTEKELDNWKKRKMLYLASATQEERDEWLDHYLICSPDSKFLDGSRNPVSYNFRITKNGSIEYRGESEQQD